VITHPALAGIGPLMDGTGSNLDEFVTEAMLLVGAIVLYAGVRRVRGSGYPGMPVAVAWGLLPVSVALVVGAFVVPSVYLRPKIASVRPASTAKIHILMPIPDQRVAGPTMEVRLGLEGGRVSTITTTQLQPNVGHIHLSIDGSLVSMTYGLQQRVLVNGLARGDHTLEAEFVASDHGPFNPRVTASKTFVKVAA